MMVPASARKPVRWRGSSRNPLGIHRVERARAQRRNRPCGKTGPKPGGGEENRPLGELYVMLRLPHPSEPSPGACLVPAFVADDRLLDITFGLVVFYVTFLGIS
uniref:Uncharacterized protein n=1 Tax=Panagrellus redivivus TaxID=6233 RepID=A0A7E4VVG0_PANRE